MRTLLTIVLLAITLVAQSARGVLRRPVSFAYPAYVSNAMAVGVLAQRGNQFARIGGARPYRPTVDNPLLIPSYSTSGDHLERIFAAFEQAKNGQIVVLTIHGVPDVAHPWVTTPPELFRQYLAWLHDHHYRVIAMRDLAKYIDPARALAATSSTTSAGSGTARTTCRECQPDEILPK